MDGDLEAGLRAEALRLGFSGCGIAAADDDAAIAANLAAFVELGLHGDMAWLAATAERRKSVRALWPEARSAVVLAVNYTPSIDPLARLDDGGKGVISVYALGRDYHDVMKPKLKALASWLGSETNAEVKVFVDTAPLMEKPLAAKAGLGWQGKHTNLVSRRFGSWLFLGVVLTTCELAPDVAEADHCGTCRACLDICPTRAFPAPYRLDPRRCISYLTIEHKGHIAREFREALGNRIYGCDDCLAVCPWNKFAHAGRDMGLAARGDLVDPPLTDFLVLDDTAFRRLFAGSPVKRIGRDRFVRNVLIAVGNSRDRLAVPYVLALIDDRSALVRAMVPWALARIADEEEFLRARSERQTVEHDSDVLMEWESGLDAGPAAAHAS